MTCPVRSSLGEDGSAASTGQQVQVRLGKKKRVVLAADIKPTAPGEQIAWVQPSASAGAVSPRAHAPSRKSPSRYGRSNHGQATSHSRHQRERSIDRQDSDKWSSDAVSMAVFKSSGQHHGAHAEQIQVPTGSAADVLISQASVEDFAEMSLTQLRAELQDVDRLYEEMKSAAIRQAKMLIEFYGITAQEIESGAQDASTSGADIGVEANLSGSVKFRHPVTGEVWDGVGEHPQWMRQALLRDGYRVADLRVDCPVLAD